MSATSWILLAVIYVTITAGLLIASWWVNRLEPRADLAADRWLFIAAIFWPLFVLVVMILGLMAMPLSDLVEE